MPINSFLYPGAKVAPPFTVANSCRFDDGSSDSMNRSNGTPTNLKKFSISLWFKRPEPGLDKYLITGYDDENNRTLLQFSSDQLLFQNATGGSNNTVVKSNAVFRDPSAWYHFCVIVDTTQSTDSNRVKMYVNGSQVTSLASSTYPNQNTDMELTDSANSIILNQKGDNSDYNSGYYAEVVVLDGTAASITDFGQFNEDTPTVWEPKDVTGLTFGNNGFYLDFEDSSNLGNDASGGTDFTVSNLASTDQSTDTCTNNFATLNPIKILGTATTTFKEGNLQFTTSNSNWANTSSTIAFTKGKWYAEFKVIALASSTGYGSAGVADINAADDNTSASTINVNGESAGVIFDHRSGQSALKSGGSSVTSNIGNFSTNDIVGMAVDMDNKALYVHLNGTYYQISSVTGVPTSGSSKTGAITIPASVIDCAFTVGSYTDKSETAVNFGSPAFSISSGNSDANGHGNFEFSVPSGYYALNTKNLAEFG